MKVVGFFWVLLSKMNTSFRIHLSITIPFMYRPLTCAEGPHWVPSRGTTFLVLHVCLLVPSSHHSCAQGSIIPNLNTW